MRILVAEPNEDVADTLAQVLLTMGHEVDVGHDVASAMSIVKRERLQACIIDLDLPPHGGAALLSSLHCLDLPCRTRAVAWTAAEEVWRHSSVARLFDAFLSKPASIDTISAALLGRPCPACARPLDAKHRHPMCNWTWP